MSFDLRALGGQIARLLWVGLRFFACALLAATACGSVLARRLYDARGGLGLRWCALAAVLALAGRVRTYFPPVRLCTDNAAMIAGLAYPLLRARRASDLRLDAVPTKVRA